MYWLYSIWLWEQNGDTALMWTCYNDLEKVATALLDHGADANAADKVGKKVFDFIQ